MQKLPIEYFIARVTKYKNILQWIDFRGGRPWLRMSESTCGFTLGLASETHAIQKDKILFFDKLGRTIDAKIETLAKAPQGFSNFETLPPDQKSILEVELTLDDNPADYYPITLYMPTDDGPNVEAVFTVQPSLYYPAFLFDAVQNYGPAVSDTFDNFVETGSLYGHTSIFASYFFKSVYTIELSQILYDYLKPVTTARKNLKVKFGNSADVLPEIIRNLNGPTVFFLDAHWSGDSSVDFSKGGWSGYPSDTAHLGSTQTPNPEEQKPIKSEFKSIFDNFQSAALIIIDDWSIMGEANEAFEKVNWTHLSQGELIQFFAASPRTVFHHKLDETRYIVGLKPIA